LADHSLINVPVVVLRLIQAAIKDLDCAPAVEIITEEAGVADFGVRTFGDRDGVADSLARNGQ